MPTSRAVRFALASLLVLTAALVAGSADAYRLEGGRWQARTIRYYTETAAYAWSVDTAAYAWNTSGVRIQFVKSRRANANVLVGIRWYKQAGDARVHRLGGRITRAEIGIQSGHDRYEMALIVAHELGHVLGLGHELHGCATMNPTVGSDHTTFCPAPPAGWWTCRLLQADDVRGAVSLYGGNARPWRGSPFCSR
jgi:Matrixin